jgi:hypothetical protein
MIAFSRLVTAFKVQFQGGLQFVSRRRVLKDLFQIVWLERGIYKIVVVLQRVDGSLMNERIEDNKCTHCSLEFLLLTKLLKLTKHVCMHYFLN